jgi:hypothetical protein
VWGIILVAQEVPTVCGGTNMGQARYIDSPDTFKLTLHGYCGMPIPIVEEGDMAECRSAVAQEVRRLRAQGFPVVTLEKGTEWEVQEPEDSCMVPDECGVLHLRPIKIRVFDCWNCGADLLEGESCNCMEACEEEQEEEEESEE